VIDRSCLPHPWWLSWSCSPTCGGCTCPSKVWGARICRGHPVGSFRRSCTLEVVSETWHRDTVESAGLNEEFQVYTVPRGCIPAWHAYMRVAQATAIRQVYVKPTYPISATTCTLCRPLVGSQLHQIVLVLRRNVENSSGSSNSIRSSLS
jgi:hypothetical protein